MEFGWLVTMVEINQYSTDASLLKEVHNIVDTMPIRQTEMAERNKKCDQGVWLNGSLIYFKIHELV